MFVGRNVNEFEVEEEDGSNSVVDGGVGLDIGVVEHALDKFCIHFDHQVADAKEVETEGAKSVE